jgi:hypothetical protein
MKNYIVSKNLILMFAFISLYTLFNNSRSTSASEPTEVYIEEPDHQIEYTVVDREQNLIAFFERYDSPLVDNVDTFIDTADKYGLDYRLLPAISCMESGCGKRYIPDSKNPFGWGVYGGNYIKFADFDDAIETVGEGLYSGYVAKGADTVEKIAPIYTPPNHVHWLKSVRFFMNQIDNA